MKSIKNFLNESNNEEKTPIMWVIHHGGHAEEPKVPSVLIKHGKHSITPKLDDKIPSVLIRHGSHGFPKDKLKEDASDARNLSWFYQHENSHLGPTHMAVGRVMSEKHQFNDEEISHISNYTHSSWQLNEHLYNTAKNKKEPGKIFIAGFGKNYDIDGLDKATNKHSLEHDLHIYSGLSFNPHKELSKNKTGLVHLPAFTSTSVSKDIAFNYAKHNQTGGIKHILHIHMKPGDRGAYIDQHSVYNGEHEMLLPRNTTLKVHPKPHIEEKDGHTVHVWRAVIHHQE